MSFAIIAVSIMGIVLGAILTFTMNLFFFKKNAQVKETERIATEHRELVERVGKMEVTLTMIGQSILPMSTAFQAILVKELTHFHTPVVDALLEKLGPPLTITEEEMETLKAELIKRTEELDPLVGEAERESAIILPYVIKRVKRERDGGGQLMGEQIQLVSVSTDSPDTIGQTAP